MYFDPQQTLTLMQRIVLRRLLTVYIRGVTELPAAIAYTVGPIGEVQSRGEPTNIEVYN